MDGRNHVIELQKLDAAHRWKPVGRYHAAVNKSSGKEYLSAGAVQSQLQLVFSLRYCSEIAAIRLNTQLYRIAYNGGIYKVNDYDDYKEQHRTVRLLGVSYVGL